MGWEKRGGHQYYYRKERDGSRVKSVYVGRGGIANMISSLQATAGLVETAIGVAYPSEIKRLKDQDANIEQACRLIESLTDAALLAAGFHTHKRQWRKKRYGDNTTNGSRG